MLLPQLCNKSATGAKKSKPKVILSSADPLQIVNGQSIKPSQAENPLSRRPC